MTREPGNESEPNLGSDDGFLEWVWIFWSREKTFEFERLIDVDLSGSRGSG